MSAAVAFALLAAPVAYDHHEGGDEPAPIELFDGESLSGWTAVLSKEDVDPATVWSAKDGVLSCTGKPSGYIRTDREFENYKFIGPVALDRHARQQRRAGPRHPRPNALGVWPKCQEVQLAHENAGDFWVIGSEIKTPLEGVPGYEKMVRGRRHLNFNDGAEKPVGEWNEMTVICRGDTITVLVNGVVVNYGFDSSVTRGSVCLQSEGAPIEYREDRADAAGGSEP